MKNWIASVFKKKVAQIPPMPPWESVVEIMYDKQLDSFLDEVVKVIYSKDKTKRYVIIKSKKGFLSYGSEEIYAFDEDEWQFIGKEKDALPGYWCPLMGSGVKSIFEREEELMKELICEPEYKCYFE